MLRKPILLALGALLVASGANAQALQFTIDPVNTYTDGTTDVRLYTSGSMIGNYNAVLRPNGTRTKPGTSGTFGVNENVAVSVAPFLEIGGQKKLNSSGTFNLLVNKTNHTVRLSNYNVDRLADGDLVIGSTIALNNEAFRTKNPTFVFPANIPPVRLGKINVTMLRVTEVAASDNGILVDVGPGKYRVVVTFMAKVEMNVMEFGQSTPITFNVPYALVGNLDMNGTVATLGYGPGQGGENVTVNLNYPLQEFPIELAITPQLTPGFKFELTIKRVRLAINGIRKFAATAPNP